MDWVIPERLIIAYNSELALFIKMHACLISWTNLNLKVFISQCSCLVFYFSMHYLNFRVKTQKISLSRGSLSLECKGWKAKIKLLFPNKGSSHQFNWFLGFFFFVSLYAIFMLAGNTATWWKVLYSILQILSRYQKIELVWVWLSRKNKTKHSLIALLPQMHSGTHTW